MDITEKVRKRVKGMMPYWTLNHETEENLDFLNGNTFKYFIAPILYDNSQDELTKAAQKTLSSQLGVLFNTKNFCDEGIKIYTSGLLGKPIKWQVDKGRRKGQAEQILQNWWNTAKVKATLKKATRYMLADGKAYIRCYETKRGEFRVMVPEPIRVTEIFDEEDGETVGFDYVYGNFKEEQRRLLTNRGDRLVIRLFENEVELVERYIDVPFVSFYIIKFEGDSLLTETVKRQQLACDLTLTMLNMNNISAGFTERVLSNAQLDVQLVTDPETGKQSYKFQSLESGPFKTISISGKPIYGEDRETVVGYTEPKMQYRDAASVDNQEKSVRIFKEIAFEDMGCYHFLMDAGADMSGESRIQLRSVWETRLTEYIPTLSEGTSQISDLFLIKNEFTDAKTTAQIQLKTGQITALEQAETRANVQAKLISRSTAQSQIGIEDTDAEDRLIKRDLEDETLNPPDPRIVLSRNQPSGKPINSD